MSSLSLAQAAPFTVTNLDDSGSGSLRQAIIDANGNDGLDTIAFASTVRGTIVLTSGQILISDSLTINGPGADVLAISGNNSSRIFYLSDASGVDVMAGKALTINRLTLKNGNSTQDSTSSRGGAIGSYSGGASLLTLKNCVLSGNSASNGGAIYKAGGTLTVRNSTLTGNSAKYGGGIFNEGGVNIENSTATVNNSTLSYNSAVAEGGGIYNFGGGWDTGAILIVNNSTVFGNSAANGGGIYTVGHVLSVNNSTVSGNSATTGGGIWFRGFYPDTDPPTGRGDTGTIANSIIAGNLAGNGKEIYRETVDPSGPGLLTSLGYNLFGENGESGLVEVTPLVPPLLGGDLVLPGAINTALGPLAYNGGSTKTLLPVAGSLAIDHGDNNLIPFGVTNDQRGPGFRRIVNTTVDIGAVEAGTPFTTYSLTTSKTGGNGLVASLSGDIRCGSTCADSFTSGTLVTLSATPDAGYQFDGWSGSCAGVKPTCVLRMDAVKQVTALFSNIVSYPLTVGKDGNGAGVVTGDDIACGTDCTQRYPDGTTVTLTAKPAAGSSLYEWIGCDSVNAALKQCTVTMDKARTIKAIFAKPALLTVKKAGLGKGTVVSLPLGIACGTDCKGVYPYKTIVYLLPIADIGSTFSAWTSCPKIISYAGAKVCAATMTQARTVTAAFKKP